MASAKRQHSEPLLVEEEEEEGINNPKKPKAAADSEYQSSLQVLLNPADCDLDFNIEGNGLVGYGLYEEGFAYCWSGARANVGITRGRYCFGCKVVSALPVVMEDTPFEQQHVCRLGISRGDDMVGNLGESKNSFGYGGTGKFSNSGKFSNYGERFGVGDTIVCCIDLENKPLASIGFSKNGKWLGAAIQFDAGPLGLGVVDSPIQDSRWSSAVFPHVLLKNVVVQMQFSVEDGLVPEQGFKPWVSAIEDRNMTMGPTFSDPRDCEVIMMVGLPASGKTTWAEKMVKEHPEKRYVLLGTNLILDQMKVPGLLRKNNYGERFDRLMDRATGIFNVVLSRAANIPRNYIIDQTNVYKSARKRKLKPFADYQKIAVVVFPKPEELIRRSDKRFKEMGKEVPPDAVNNMIANFVLPKSKDMHQTDEFFDQVMFVDLNRDESQKYLNQMKQDLTPLSNNNSTLSRGKSLSGSHLPSQGSLTGSGIHQHSTYPLISPSNSGMPNHVNVSGHVIEQHGSMNSLSGVHPHSQIPPVAGAPSPFGPHSNSKTSWFPVDNAGYNQTYGVVPTGGPYSRPNTVGNYMGFHGTYLDPYRSGMNEPSPIANARPVFSDYRTHGRPYYDNSGFRPDLHAPAPYDALSPYGTPNPRPPSYGSLPDNMQYSGVHPSQRPRYP
ncbi:hypothetical protein RIF29_41460 [Crotalaria pallida]|uniref:SPRY domain-containing protein n=1 Tax=Crotalaria pallida TaxID=3830 RepID=A0AAN9E5Q9_CROPI